MIWAEYVRDVENNERRKINMIDTCVFCHGEAYAISGTSIRIDVKRDTRDHYLIFANDFTKEFGSKRIHYCPVCGRYLDGKVERVNKRCMDWYE